MTTTQEIGAVSEDLIEPKEAIIQKARQEISRLQARIVKAEEEGRHNKVKVLQRMLTHSHYAKILAVEQVAHNQGRKTPGVDGQT